MCARRVVVYVSFMAQDTRSFVDVPFVAYNMLPLFMTPPHIICRYGNMLMANTIAEGLLALPSAAARA